MEFDPYWKWLGIDPEQQPADHYQLLGIRRFEDDDDVIENAAVRQMAHVRTFQGGQHAELSQQLLNELSAARICLLNLDQKQAYDEELESQLPSEPPVEDVPLATPVAPAAPLPVAQQVSPTAAAAPTPASTATTSSRQRTRSRRRRQQRSARSSQLAWMLVLVAVITLLIAVALGIFLFRRNSKEGDEQARQLAPSLALFQPQCPSTEY